MAEISEKVLRYETFLNDTLKDNLKSILEQRDKIFGEISEYLQLKHIIENMVENKLDKETLKTKVDLGCNFYVQAKVQDPSRIFVCVGYGFYVEFTLKEALNFIEKKVAQLTENSEGLTKDAVKIKTHIKLVLEGLREIQGIKDEPDKKPFRDVL